MRIFLSYASEQRAIAEPIAFALRGRGHRVFFDKTDLPPGGNYDAQIERAIKQSDLMIFLISPESVSPGRFTLTELAFARQRWGSARGQVFPVMISATPVSHIPVFLTSVEIMQPEGNIAAEVASVIDGLTPIASPLYILPVALAMGIVSGLLCRLPIPYPSFISWLNGAPIVDAIVQFVFIPEDEQYGKLWHVPYVFSVFVASILIFWDNTRVSRSLWVVPIIVAGWGAAYSVGFWIILTLFGGGVTQDPSGLYSTLVPEATQCQVSIWNGKESLQNPSYIGGEVCKEIDKYKEQISPLINRLTWLAYTVAGMLSGFIGSLITIFGLGVLSTRLRPLDAIVLVTFVGTLVGMLLNPHLFIIVTIEKEVSISLLFVVWQASVAMAIAWQFTKPPPATVA